MTTYQIISLVLSLVGIPSLATVVGWIWKAQKENRKKQDEVNRQQQEEFTALKCGVQAILRDRLLQCYRYHKNKGHITYDEKANFINMYTNYSQLHSNGVMHDIYEDFKTIPVDHDSII